ncbi:TRAP transporter small permease [Desulfobacula sp.]|uniref:TRAP transporter small permease n=1 Tax=Desulfobacula sp. TaxID=2593537 RepID=UPI0026199BF1|nr:TRAP transporter small permease [Desulfobacula sp.]
MKNPVEIIDRIQTAMIILAGIMLIFIMLSVCLEVVLRNLFNTSLIWITEVTEVLLLYITFLGSAWVLKEGGHVKVDIILSRLSPRKISFLGIFSSIIGIFVCLILTVYGFKLTMASLQNGLYTTSALEIPMWIILIIIPIGGLMLLIQFMRRTLRFVTRFFIESKKNNTQFEG